MTPYPITTGALDPSLVLDEEDELERALELVTRRAEPLVAFRIEGQVAALSALELRFLHQAGVDSARRLGELPGRNLRFPSEGEAREALERDPSLAGALVEADGTLTLVRREVPAVERAVVMAGGFGSRLRPLTDGTPKPLLEVGGRVLLFRILDGLRDHGVTRAWISIHHLGEQIRDAVGDGSQWGMELAFLDESTPLDTGAGLAMLGEADGPFFVVNGDLLTNVNFGALGRAHRLSGALGTVATYLYPTSFPYGIVHHEGGRLQRIEEKPVLRHPVNAGMYVFSAEVLELVEHGKPLAMVDFLNEQLIPRGAAATWPIVEHWNDVGTHAAFERAQREAREL